MFRTPSQRRLDDVSNSLYLQSNPNGGLLIDGDAVAVPRVGSTASVYTISLQDGTAINFGAVGNGATTNLTGAAYTNSYGQPLTGGVTTLYTLDEVSDSLFIQNPPNPGTQLLVSQLTLGGSPLDFSAINGFAIQSTVAVATSNSAAPANSLAFATLQVGGVIGLYTINLTTGAATSLGTVGTVFAFAVGG